MSVAADSPLSCISASAYVDKVPQIDNQRPVLPFSSPNHNRDVIVYYLLIDNHKRGRSWPTG